MDFKYHININVPDSQLLQIINHSLPVNFSFKTLNISYIDQIYNLLNKNYIEDDQNIMRVVYSKDFLYWYLKKIPDEFIVGLIYEKKLIGLVTALIIDTIISKEIVKLPYINLLCVHKKLRNSKLASLLLREITNRLYKKNIRIAFFSDMRKLCEPLCSTKDFIIPINYSKLKEANFLLEDLNPLPSFSNNPLHLMKEHDIDIVTENINIFMNKHIIKPLMTNKIVKDFLLTKKNIVYSFIKKDNDNITDFISIYKSFIYSIETNKIISNGTLAFYYNNSLELTDLVSYLLDKLKFYNIDQFIFKDNIEDINLTKFSTYGNLYYFFYNLDIDKINSTDFIFYPI